MDLEEVWEQAQDNGFNSISDYLEFLFNEKEEHILQHYDCIRGK
jgi:hypothetical protein